MYKKIIPVFPAVPFVRQFDYYNGLAFVYVKFTSTRSLDAVRGYFFRLYLSDSAQLASSPPEVADSSTQGETLPSNICPTCQGYGCLKSFSIHADEFPLESEPCEDCGSTGYHAFEQIPLSAYQDEYPRFTAYHFDFIINEFGSLISLEDESKNLNWAGTDDVPKPPDCVTYYPAFRTDDTAALMSLSRPVLLSNSRD